jgi:4,5-dihydroxyphthalate decarboxylase
MSDLALTIATGMHERGRPLAERRVATPGLDLTTILIKDNGARHDRFLAGEFDGAELSFAMFLSRFGRQDIYGGIPVFLNRQFRHSAIFINKRAGINQPRDLNGKRIGILTWMNTAALWARGVLVEHGVDLGTVRWVSGDRADVGSELIPKAFAIEAAAKPLLDLLLSGEIDALITPRTPSRDHPETVARLFPNFAEVEADYFRQTGAYPSSHVLVVRLPLLEQHPWLANALFQAACKARLLAHEYASDPEHSTLAWYGAYHEREVALMGADADAYGIEPNRKTLEKMLEYAHAAGLIAERPPVAELFHPSARNLVPDG